MNTNFPHDRIIKNLMSDRLMAEDFLKHYLPQSIREMINFETLVLCPNTYINKTLELVSSDILFQVNIADNLGFLYILFEHQSTVDPLMPFRLLHYTTEIWSNYIKQTQKKTIPLIIPMVFYHGKKPYNGPRDIKELIEAPIDLIENFLLKPFHLIDTHTLDDETLKKQNWAGFMAFIMKNIYARDFMHSKRILYEMLINLTNKDKLENETSIINLLNYLVQYGNTEQPDIFIKEVSEILPSSSNVKEKFMGTVANYLHNKGREEGREEALKEGRKTSSTMLQNLIRLRFNTDLSNYQDQINQADFELLEKWSNKVLHVETIEQVFEAN